MQDILPPIDMEPDRGGICICPDVSRSQSEPQVAVLSEELGADRCCAGLSKVYGFVEYGDAPNLPRKSLPAYGANLII